MCQLLIKIQTFSVSQAILRLACIHMTNQLLDPSLRFPCLDVCWLGAGICIRMDPFEIVVYVVKLDADGIFIICGAFRNFDDNSVLSDDI